MPTALRMGIPDLDLYSRRRGIGRYTHEVVDRWRAAGHTVVGLPTRSTAIPLLRNARWGLAEPVPTLDVLFVPNIVGIDAVPWSRRGPPVVVAVMDLGFLDSPLDRSKSSRVARALGRIHLLKSQRRASRAIAISQFTRKRLGAYAPRLAARSQTVYLGVHRATFQPRDGAEAHRSIKLGDDDFALVYAGAEYRRKNLPVLMAVCGGLSTAIESGPAGEARLGLPRVRSGRDAAAMARHGLRAEHDVLFVDDPDDTAMATVYSAGDLFVTASTYEGFGLPLLEAMACGLPAVVSHAGSLPEIGGDVAEYAEPNDVDGFVERIMSHVERPVERPMMHAVE